MGAEEPKDLLKNVDWKTLGSAPSDQAQAGGPVFKKRLPKRLRQVPDYYFLPRMSTFSAIAMTTLVCAAGVGAGMLVEVWINKKIEGKPALAAHLPFRPEADQVRACVDPDEPPHGPFFVPAILA